MIFVSEKVTLASGCYSPALPVEEAPKALSNVNLGAAVQHQSAEAGGASEHLKSDLHRAAPLLALASANLHLLVPYLQQALCIPWIVPLLLQSEDGLSLHIATDTNSTSPSAAFQCSTVTFLGPSCIHLPLFWRTGIAPVLHRPLHSPGSPLDILLLTYWGGFSLA